MFDVIDGMLQRHLELKHNLIESHLHNAYTCMDVVMRRFIGYAYIGGRVLNFI